MQNVAVLGASTNPERYSYKAIDLLKNYGHKVYPSNPQYQEILGQKVYPTIASIPDKVDTLTLYVNATLSSQSTNDILALKPKRVIFNPGSENPALQTALENAGIECLEACTLVMLRTNQF